MNKPEIKKILIEKYRTLLVTPEMVIDIVVDAIELSKKEYVESTVYLNENFEPKTTGTPPKAYPTTGVDNGV